MLPAMSRMIWLIPLLVLGCGKSASSNEKDPTTTTNGDKVPVPTDRVPIAGAPGGGEKAPASDSRALHPDEGSLTIDKAEGKAGTELTSNITITPASAYHVNTEYPTAITLEPPAGVKLAKVKLSAGGMEKSQGDATTFTEKALAFAVKATAEKAGTYDIKGEFKFAVCTNAGTQCLAKKQPITVTVAAN